MNRLLYRKSGKKWDYIGEYEKGNDEAALKAAQHVLIDGDVILVISPNQVTPSAREYSINKKLKFKEL